MPGELENLRNWWTRSPGPWFSGVLGCLQTISRFCINPIFEPWTQTLIEWNHYQVIWEHPNTRRIISACRLLCQAVRVNSMIWCVSWPVQKLWKLDRDSHYCVWQSRCDATNHTCLQAFFIYHHLKQISQIKMHWSAFLPSCRGGGSVQATRDAKNHSCLQGSLNRFQRDWTGRWGECLGCCHHRHHRRRHCLQ